MSLTTKPWHAPDIPTVLELNQHNVPHLSGLNQNELETLAAQAALFEIVELDKQFAGVVLALMPDVKYGSENLRWFNQNYSDFLYIDRVAVADHAQKHGCASALYDVAEEFCRDNAIANIALEVNTCPLNQGSLDFHHRMDFKEVGVQDTGGGEKTVSMMMKTLRIAF